MKHPSRLHPDHQELSDQEGAHASRVRLSQVRPKEKNPEQDFLKAVGGFIMMAFMFIYMSVMIRFGLSVGELVGFPGLVGVPVGVFLTLAIIPIMILLSRAFVKIRESISTNSARHFKR